MNPDSTEAVGAAFDVHQFDVARTRAWAALAEVAPHVQPGMTEAEARELVEDVLRAHGSSKLWHPTKVRFGVNTLRTFREPSDPGVTLGKHDIFFLDIGPVFRDHEADVGRTYVVGDAPELVELAQAAERLWHEVAGRWANSGESGRELYAFAESAARRRGYELSMDGAGGHRLSDFPHALHHKGTLRVHEGHPQGNRWVLEIQIRHPRLGVGAFFEDLLR
jgi:Xaa-Pro aminopeptidase